MAASQTILIIEDDREISSTIRGLLEGAGYTVLDASNGVEGRRLVEQEKPDLVITDMMMPKMGGFPVLEYLKDLPESSRPRIIMITANEGGRHKAYAEMLGVDAYLRKPFAMDVLMESVNSVLNDKGGKKSTAKSGGKKQSTGTKTKRKKSS